jgi:hypothetical protein
MVAVEHVMVVEEVEVEVEVEVEMEVKMEVEHDDPVFVFDNLWYCTVNLVVQFVLLSGTGV